MQDVRVGEELDVADGEHHVQGEAGACGFEDGEGGFLGGGEGGDEGEGGEAREGADVVGVPPVVGCGG